MPPSSGDVAQTPESKISGGLASVFKSFTGNRSTRSALSPPSSYGSNPTASVQIARELNSPTTLRGGIFGGPSDYEQLYIQLKDGKTLAERRAAAEGLRLALADYPLSGVCPLSKSRKWFLTSPPSRS
jgi:hypothetical protein